MGADEEYMDRRRSAYPRVSGEQRNGLPEPSYEYHGGGHDTIDPMDCSCGDPRCPARLEAARRGPRNRKAHSKP